jgi:hypothetical protein
MSSNTAITVLNARAMESRQEIGNPTDEASDGLNGGGLARISIALFLAGFATFR